MSPASGDTHRCTECGHTGFHSINVPSEWGPLKFQRTTRSKPAAASFHSINVPSEWGQRQVFTWADAIVVSIQLMSPASGDLTTPSGTYPGAHGFPFN
jgi:hypothetical protein